MGHQPCRYQQHNALTGFLELDSDIIRGGSGSEDEIFLSKKPLLDLDAPSLLVFPIAGGDILGFTVDLDCVKA
jgi:hypothetical protein